MTADEHEPEAALRQIEELLDEADRVADEDGAAAALPLDRALVEEHFDTTPDEVAGEMVDAALRVANADRESGAADRSLALIERVRARFGQDGAPEADRTRLLADLYASYALGDLGRQDEAVARVDAVLAWLDEHEDEVALDGTLDRMREDALEARSYLALARGIALQRRLGHGPEAEAAFRAPEARRRDDACLYLGLLLATDRARAAEARDLLRRALELEEIEQAGYAAYWLALLTERTGDREEAARLYGMAAALGERGALGPYAMGARALVTARGGDPAEVEELLLGYVRAYGEARGIEDEAWVRRTARVVRVWHTAPGLRTVAAAVLRTREAITRRRLHARTWSRTARRLDALAVRLRR